MKIASISKFAHILSLRLNEEPLLEQITSEITLKVSTDISVTSLTSHFIDPISSDHMHVEKHLIIEELDALTPGCK